jgi:GT2 family glycosyltransferase
MNNPVGSPPILSVIIVNYNVRYFLEQALLSVRKASEGMAVEVFVVDNNSVDESVRMVREKFGEVRLVANTQNVGFSAANNQAIEQARGKYILLLNPDTVVKEDTFATTIAFMERTPQAGAVGVHMIDGQGKFLPESKRGFPSPEVAFYKSFGLAALFPKSRRFGRYHLGYLPEDETHEVDVLSGAFMLLRKSVLDEIGLLDETFFMYGEDIDLSYRVIQAGYKNYYFADTTIIHYKGESTKKGSLNYVRVFYNAMIIFAEKHFSGQQARAFIYMMRLAIYVRATLTLVVNVLKSILLPLSEALLIAVSMYFLQRFWATNVYQNAQYYAASFLYFNIPLYIMCWLGGTFLTGGYDRPADTARLARGVLLGTLFLAAVYGFLDTDYRSSRALILLGSVAAFGCAYFVRYLFHFVRYRNFNMTTDLTSKVVIVGSEAEATRVLHLLRQAQVNAEFIGIVSPDRAYHQQALGRLSQLDEIVSVYKVTECIFCSHDVSAHDIMKWMTRLGSNYQFKIVPQESLSIIGSNSRDTAGDLYTIDIRFALSDRTVQRNKRLFDLVVCLLLLPVLPLCVLVVGAGVLPNWWRVLTAQCSWVGYAPTPENDHTLPKIKRGILYPSDGLRNLQNLHQNTLQRLNFLYAKNYSPVADWDILWRAWRLLGKRV